MTPWWRHEQSHARLCSAMYVCVSCHVSWLNPIYPIIIIIKTEVRKCMADRHGTHIHNSKHESGWWEGIRLSNNTRGWFPSNHVEVLSRSNTPCTPIRPSHATPTPPQQLNQTCTSKRLSTTSTTSVASLSRRSTVLANEASGASRASGASSFGGTSLEGGPVHSEGGTPGTPDVKLRDMNVPGVCSWLTGESSIDLFLTYFFLL